MPKCWFVLLMFWLRVDDTVVRLRETRYYCEEADSAKVWRETKHVEGTFEELAEAGAPSSNVRSTAVCMSRSLCSAFFFRMGGFVSPLVQCMCDFTIQLERPHVRLWLASGVTHMCNVEEPSTNLQRS
jgi:hypothetical protein